MTTKTQKCDGEHAALIAQTKAETYRRAADYFDLLFHSRFTGTEVAKILRDTAADVVESHEAGEEPADEAEGLTVTPLAALDEDEEGEQ